MANLNAMGRDVQSQAGHPSVFYETDTVLALNTDYATSSLPGAAANDWIRTGALRRIYVNGFTSHAGDANTLILEQSEDGSTTDRTTPFMNEFGLTTFGAGHFEGWANITHRFWRVVYRNAGTNQTRFNFRVRGIPRQGQDLEMRGHEVTSGLSAADTIQTVSTPADEHLRKVLWVSMVYSAGASVTGTITHDSRIGAAYDFKIAEIAFGGLTDGLWTPEASEGWVQPGSQLDCVAPAGGGALTSTVTILAEVWE